MNSPDGLYGGGCTVLNELLVHTAAFYKENGQPVLSKKSYYIDLGKVLTLDASSRLAWTEAGGVRRIPGAFVRESILTPIMYTIGTRSTETPRLERRDEDDDPLAGVAVEDIDAFPTRLGDEPETITSEVYLEALEKGLKLALGYRDAYYLLRNPDNNEMALSSITRSPTVGLPETIPLANHPPPYAPGYSVALRLDTAYFAADGYIYSLNLTAREWHAHAVPGFRAARSGCLAIHRNTLIHAFGSEGDKYLNRTQFVDMDTWSLKQTLNTREEGRVAGQKNSYTLVVVFSACLALLLLAALATLVIVVVRKRRKLPELTAPEYYTDTVWASPAAAYELDLSLSSGPEISGDFTPNTSPFSSGQNTGLSQDSSGQLVGPK